MLALKDILDKLPFNGQKLNIGLLLQSLGNVLPVAEAFIPGFSALGLFVPFALQVAGFLTTIVGAGHKILKAK